MLQPQQLAVDEESQLATYYLNHRRGPLTTRTYSSEEIPCRSLVFAGQIHPPTPGVGSPTKIIPPQRW